MKKNNGNSPNQSIPYIEYMVMVLFIFYFILPAFQSLFPFQNFVLCEILYAGYLAYKVPDLRGYIKMLTFIALLISVLYFLMTDTQTISVEAGNIGLKRIFSKFYQFYSMFYPSLLFFRLNKEGSVRQRWLLLFISLVLIGYVTRVTLLELQINNRITRTNVALSELTTQKNIGTYAFVYCIPYVIVCLTLYGMKMRSIVAKVMLILLTLYFFNFIIESQYTLAFLISIIGLVLMSQHSANPTVRFLIIILAPMCLLLLPSLIDFAVHNISSEDMKTRLSEIRTFLVEGNDSGYNMKGRNTLYWESIVAFLQSPIWGNRQLDFDGHATFLTILSDLGILGGIPFYWLLFNVKNRVSSVLSESRKYFSVIFFMYLCMGFTNPIHSSMQIACGAWFVALVMISLIPQLQQKKYEKREFM